MKLIIGLGNQGKEYEHTRHNVGFMCIEHLREKLNFPEWQLNKKFQALISEGNFSDEKFLLVQPHTYMNKSGETVSRIYTFYKCKPHDLWLIHDDVDLPLGKIRIRRSGSAGTHNGMKSVIAALGFENFPRVKIGIENRKNTHAKKQDTTSFVLHPFSRHEQSTAKHTIETAAQTLLYAFEHGVEAAMEKYN